MRHASWGTLQITWLDIRKVSGTKRHTSRLGTGRSKPSPTAELDLKFANHTFTLTKDLGAASHTKDNIFTRKLSIKSQNPVRKTLEWVQPARIGSPTQFPKSGSSIYFGIPCWMLFFIVSLKKVFLILPFACLRMTMIYTQALMIMIYTLWYTPRLQGRDFGTVGVAAQVITASPLWPQSTPWNRIQMEE